MLETMNILSYKITEDRGLSFELLVDGKSLRELIDSGNEPIPYYFFLSENEWPAYDTRSETLASGSRIVTVCSCGDVGCGHTECEISREGETVVFRNFKYDVGAEGQKIQFRFMAENYETVLAEIILKAHEYERRT